MHHPRLAALIVAALAIAAPLSASAQQVQWPGSNGQSSASAAASSAAIAAQGAALSAEALKNAPPGCAPQLAALAATAAQSAAAAAASAGT